ncbi:MAG: carboxypeptidase-like regulatory domain-containing protein [Bacteroidales bacterium]|nr:carboxypeptidase-like regulatory domain-containing protein [Bacteroidales bacterium]
MKLLLSIIISLIALHSFGQKYVISGYVKDASSGEELIGATILVKETNAGIATNYYGFYSVSLPSGKYTIICSYVGYETMNKTIDLSKNTNFDFVLEPESELIQEVVVGAEALDKNITSVEMSVQKLTLKEIKAVPVVFGERDILKSLTLLPGVKSGGEATGGIFVRGGGADQNLILLDEAPVYNASHLGGLFSVFNADAIKDVKLLKVVCQQNTVVVIICIRLKMKDGNDRKLSVSGGLGLISSRLAAEGPIIKEKSSFILSARRSYADLFLKFSQDTLLKNNQLFFYDFNAKANIEFNRKNKLFISGYFGKDVLKFQEILNMGWSNTTATIRWNHLFTNKLFLNSTFIYSKYLYETMASLQGNSFELSSGIKDFNIKEDFTYFLNNNNTIKFGLQGIHHTFSPGSYSFEFGGFSYSEKTPSEYAWETAFYIQNEQKITKNISINYGVRLTDFILIGEYTAHSNYNDQGIPQNSKYYAKGEVVKNHFDFEPRASANFVINEENSLKISAVKTTQYINLIQNSSGQTPIDYWLPANEIIKPQYSYQYAIGYFKNFNENMFETFIEIYYKDMFNQIDIKDGGNAFNYGYIENELIFGIGRSYGAEVSVKKVYGKYTGWVSYTLSKTEKKFDELEKIGWFPYKQDRNHDISIVGMVQISKKVNFSTSWVFYTGDKITTPSGKYLIDGITDVPVYTERNGASSKSYHRLDISLTLNLKAKPGRENTLNFSIINVYNRRNPFLTYFAAMEGVDNGTMQAHEVSLYPILPSITWNFKF